MKDERGRLWGCGVISPLRARMRQMVATEGALPSSRRRWWAIVCGPQSWPALASSPRRRTTAAWISRATAWAQERGRRERGSKAA